MFLHPDEPELEFEGFLKKRSPKVRYFQGSLMCGEDLDRTQVKMTMYMTYLIMDTWEYDRLTELTL